MCYSKLTFKEHYSPVINEPYKFFYWKVTGETKMRQNMDMNCEQTSTISKYYFLKATGTFVVRPLTSKFLDFSNDIRETSAEIPYWWRVTTQIWVMLLIGRAG